MRTFRQALIGVLTLAMVVMVMPLPALASVSVIRGMGGGALSADDAATQGGSFTSLTNPSVYEQTPGDISTGALVLAAPTGFEFRRQRVTAFATPGGSSATSLRLSATADCVDASRTAFLSATSDRVTLYVCETSEASDKRTRLTLSGLAVRPLEASPLVSGPVHLDESSTATIDGVVPGVAGTSLADLTVVPGALAALTLDPVAIQITPEATRTVVATAQDAHGNVRADQITFAADPAVGSITAQGLFTAGRTVGSSATGITASAGDLTAAASVDLVAGALNRIALTPADATAAAGSTVSYAVEAFDAYDNSRGPAQGASLTLAAADGRDGGTPTCDLLDCSSTRAGEYAVTATFEDVSTVTGLTVVPADLDRVALTPDPASVKAGETVPFEASTYDTFGNLREDAVRFDAIADAGTIDAEGLLTAATVTAQLTDAVSASAGAGEAGVTDAVDLDITAGPVQTVTIAPTTATAIAGAATSFTTTAADEFGNPVSPITPSYTIAPLDGGSLDGATCDDGTCTATIAGTYTVTSTVDGRSTTATVTVEPAAAETLTLTPAIVDVRVEASVAFSAVVADTFGNVRTGDVVTYETSDPAAGTVTPEGVFTAATVAGSFPTAVTARTGDVVATVDAVIRAGELASLAVDPSTTSAVAGATTAFTVTGADEHGNPVADIDPTFGITAEDAGSTDGSTCDETGACRATTVGTYRIDVAAGEVTTSANLSITPADLAGISIDPTSTQLAAGEPVTFSGTPVDAFGNVRDDLVSYTALPEAGTIAADGSFTAATTAGSFPGAVTATAGSFSAVADVVVVAGDVARLTIDPQATTARAGASTPFTVTAFDQFDNVVDGIVADLTILAADETSVPGAACTDGACTAERVGDYVVVASHETVEVRTTLTLVAADLARLAVTPGDAEAVAGTATTFAVAGFDVFDNPVATDAAVDLVPVTDGSTRGATCADGTCTAEIAGLYAARAVDGDVVGEAALRIVAAAADQVEIDPISAEVGVTEDFTFTGSAIDRFGNITEDLVAFEIADDRVGAITADGVLTAAEIADFFPGAIRARSGSFDVFADVLVQPGAVASIAMIPGATTITAGDMDVFAVEGLDRFGNSLGAVDAAFAIAPLEGGSPDGASCTDGGECTARIAGSYTVTATHQSGATDTATLTVEAGEPATVTIDPATVTLSPRGEQQYTARVTDAAGNPFPGEVVFTADPAAGTITPEGLFTAGGTAGVYPDAVTATSGELSGSASVTVEAGGVSTITLDPTAATIPADGAQAFTATGTDAEGNDLGVVPVTLTIDGGECEGDTCSSTTAGSYVVTATHSSGATTTADLTVVPAAAASLTVDPTAVVTVAGGSVQLDAVVADAFGNVRDDLVTIVADEAAGTVAEDGLFTAAGTVGDFPAAITATAGDLTTTVDVTVTAAAVASIELTPADATIVAGGSQVYVTEGSDSFGNPTGPVPATLSIDGDGSCADDACSSTTAGSYTVTATFEGLSDSAVLTVVPGAAASIELTPAEATVAAGEARTYSASAADAFGNDRGTVPVALSIDGDGTCEQDSCSSTTAGTYTVTATADDLTDTATLTVTAGQATTVTVTPSDATVGAGTSRPFAATVTDAFGNPAAGDVVWTADPAAGTISDAGLFTAGGTTGTVPDAVTATVDTIVGTADVTVVAGPLDRVVLDPTSSTITAGTSQPYTATGQDAFGNDRGPVQAVLTIDGDGSCEGATCTSTTAGTYTVTATSDGATGTATLTVTMAAAERIVITPEAVEATPLQTVQMTAVAEDAFGNAGSADVQWTAQATAGSIDDTGLFTAGAVAGSYPDGITATMDDLSASVDVVVVPGPATGIVLTPETATIAAGDGGQAYEAQGTDAQGNPTGPVAVTLEIEAASAPEGFDATCTDDVCAGTTAGTYTVTGTTAEGLSDTASLEILAGAAAKVTSVATPSTVNASPLAGNTSQVVVTVTDAFDNPVSGKAVTFAFTRRGSSGAIAPQLSATTATTNADGTAQVTYTSGSASGQDGVSTVSGGVGTVVTITVRPAGQIGSGPIGLGVPGRP